jgi:hypothetical protein
MNITKNQAILSLNPSLSFTLKDGVLSNVLVDEVLDTTALPTDAEIDAEVTRLQAVYDSQAYARTRKAKYDLLNQDEMRYDDVKNSTTTWIDAIDAIKAAHPKPEA